MGLSLIYKWTGRESNEIFNFESYVSDNYDNKNIYQQMEHSVRKIIADGNFSYLF